MKKIGIIYWPKDGNVEKVAEKVYSHFDKSYTDMYDIGSISGTDLVNYRCIIVGGSTVGSETWEDVEPTNKWNRLFKDLDKVNLNGKKIAIFGLGDQVLWPRNFVDSMMFLKNEFEKRGADIVGKWPVEGYSFEESASVIDDYFVGLALDEDNEYDLTDERVENWTRQVKQEFGI